MEGRPPLPRHPPHSLRGTAARHCRAVHGVVHGPGQPSAGRYPPRQHPDATPAAPLRLPPRRHRIRSGRYSAHRLRTLPGSPRKRIAQTPLHPVTSLLFRPQRVEKGKTAPSCSMPNTTAPERACRTAPLLAIPNGQAANPAHRTPLPTIGDNRSEKITPGYGLPVRQTLSLLNE